MKFNHAANLPFANRGTGISFQPATAFAHSSNEPVQALGTGIKLDSPLTKEHASNAVVHDASVTNAGYQGTPAPNQWFGGPEFTANVDSFGRVVSVREGSMVLRDASGLVVDSLNYGGLVDPWAAEGYQATSGSEQSGCRAPAPGPATGFGPAAAVATNTSAGRFPDGADTDSNCTDFMTQAAATLSAASAAGATNIKVASVADFGAGQTIMIDTGANLETAVIATVGTAGATTVGAATDVGATVIPVASATGFSAGQTITIDSGANSETAVVTSVRRFGAATITVAAPLTLAHAAGAQISGSGITLTAALTRAHASGAQVASNVPTPGAPNRYHRRPYKVVKRGEYIFFYTPREVGGNPGKSFVKRFSTEVGTKKTKKRRKTIKTSSKKKVVIIKKNTERGENTPALLEYFLMNWKRKEFKTNWFNKARQRTYPPPLFSRKFKTSKEPPWPQFRRLGAMK